jgi:hypothetical protein
MCRRPDGRISPKKSWSGGLLSLQPNSARPMATMTAQIVGRGALDGGRPGRRRTWAAKARRAVIMAAPARRHFPSPGVATSSVGSR